MAAALAAAAACLLAETPARYYDLHRLRELRFNDALTPPRRYALSLCGGPPAAPPSCAAASPALQLDLDGAWCRALADADAPRAVAFHGGTGRSA